MIFTPTRQGANCSWLQEIQEQPSACVDVQAVIVLCCFQGTRPLLCTVVMGCHGGTEKNKKNPSPSFQPLNDPQ